LLTQAREEALLTSPYFVPGAALSTLLGDKVAAGVKVSVLTNSLAATDVALVHAGYARYREVLLGGGVDLFELKTLHRKRISLTGSSRASLPPRPWWSTVRGASSAPSTSIPARHS
jgi:putative cardiolipin synthase